mgnify:CR=1 FL=1
MAKNKEKKAGKRMKKKELTRRANGFFPFKTRRSTVSEIHI